MKIAILVAATGFDLLVDASVPSFDGGCCGEAAEIVEVICADDLRAWQRVPLMLRSGVE